MSQLNVLTLLKILRKHKHLKRMSDNKANRTFSVNKKRVLLRHENPLYSTWYTLFSTWYPRHFSAVVTHYPISATHGCTLL